MKALNRTDRMKDRYPMEGKIISAGHICLDITPVFESAAEGRQIEALLQPGKLLNVGAADVHTGGSVANTGLALKLLKNDVELIGKTGYDAFGGMIRSTMEHYGVHGLIEDPESTTSYTVVLAFPGHDRIFLHHPGANDSFKSEDIPEASLKDAVLFHFGYPPLMKNMYLDDGKELVKMFRRMKEHEIATSLDLAAVDPASEAGKADWRSILQTVLPYVDFFVPSFEELCFMLDRERFDRLNTGKDMTAGLDLLKEAMPLAEEAIQLGCRAVLLKCGISGMVYKTSGAEAFKKIGSRLSLNTASWASQEGVQKCFRVEHVCSGTGAGDTSIAAFLTGVMKGYPPSECVLLGAAEGACCVMGYDALSALRPIEELRERIRLGWPVI